MSVKMIPAAVLAAVIGATPAFADLRGPAEMPPASYKGQQYTDSRGCVFLRAGHGGQVSWVPRVSRDRQQLCGYAPSGRPVEVAAPAAVAAPAPVPPAPAPPRAAPVVAPVAAPKAVAVPTAVPVAKPVTSPAPMPRVAVAPAPMAAPVRVERPATPTERAATAGNRGKVQGAPVAIAHDGYQLACPAATPSPQRFATNAGGSVVLCTKGDGTLVDANFPRMVAGSLAGQTIGYEAHTAKSAGYAAPGYGASGQAAQAGADAKPVAKPVLRGAAPALTPPPGYKLAWEDDRLNPNRGKQTVEGVIDQDRVWTRTVPAEPRGSANVIERPLKVIVRNADGTTSQREGVVVSTKSDGKRVVRLTDGAVTKSTKTEPTATLAAPASHVAQGLMVQVGTFGVPANAEGAAGRLKAQGLPVARGKAGGGKLQVVYAGPFASAAEAKSALAAARAMGFGDALILR